jgi:SAM-dependent methyltransferase
MNTHMHVMQEDRLHAFVGQVLNDLGGAYSIGLVQMGANLGLYRALHEKGPMTAGELAAHTGLTERYLREWLSHQAASGYLSYDPGTGKFALPPEQAMVFAMADSPFYLVDAFDTAAKALGNRAMVEAAFRTGGGVAWGDQDGCLFCAIARFFRPGYHNHLVAEWLPALEDVREKLERGARVADVGCGCGYSTVIMAKAFPNSEFVGFDFHDRSIADARQHAKAHGAPQNVRFEVSTAKGFGGSDYDLVTFFDCLHDMGDPAGAAARVRKALKPDGSWMIVEPMAQDRLEDNLNPVGRLYYAASTMICVPTSLSQEVGTALGAQAGEARIREVVTRGGGFTRFRRATETPFNMVLEARP